jgi:hypothetical protein
MIENRPFWCVSSINPSASELLAYAAEGREGCMKTYGFQGLMRQSFFSTRLTRIHLYRYDGLDFDRKKLIYPVTFDFTLYLS